ncbi:hypothetical protein [Parvibaculum sp.]|uniref:hypothetical protein n=1 Tax=Parvibaculum sp. TaxID=2024848 RepID=UPI0026036FAE|nr:hypothetical protein [Parvibaculum sp.]MCW5727260.1 hypothetical protein [Parvibaculum sp.]
MGIKLGVYGTDDQPVAGIRAGTVAIWNAGSGDNNYDPAIAPLDHLGDVKFHSDFDYLKIAAIVTSRDSGKAAVSLPATAEGSVMDREDVLFAHGLGFTPLVIGEIEVSSYVQRCGGSVMPLPGGNAANRNYRFCGIISDGTNVLLRSRGWAGPAGANAPAMTVHWRVLVLAERFQIESSPDYMFRFAPGEADLAALGKVDANHRFLRKAVSTGEIRIAGKETIINDVQSGFPAILQSDGAVDAAISSVDNNTPSATFSLSTDWADF